MRLGEKFHNVAEKLHGKGKATGSDRMKAEGKRHDIKSDLKQAGERVRHAFKRH
jgi:uncharacterized protein YjbJ (UPF0337 family)